MLATRSQTLISQVTQGTPAERKTALKALEDPALAPSVFDQVLPVLRASESLERHRAAKIVRRVLLKLGPNSAPWAQNIIEAVQPMLMDRAYITRKQGRELVSGVCAAAGLEVVLEYLKGNLDADLETRRATAETLAALAPLGQVLPFICAAARSHHFMVRNTALSAIISTCKLSPQLLLPSLPLVVPSLMAGLQDDHAQNRTRACTALASVADACSPFGIEALERCIPALWAGVRSRRNLGAYIRALASLVPLMDPESIDEFVAAIVALCVSNFDSHDDEVKRSILTALERAAQVESSAPHLSPLIDSFFGAFWTRRMALSYSPALVKTTLAMAKYGAVLHHIVALNALKDPSPMQALALDTLAALEATQISTAADKTQEQVCDQLVVALQSATAYDRKLVAAFEHFEKSMGALLHPYVGPLIAQFATCLGNPVPAQRQLGAVLLGSLASALGEHTERVLGILNEQLGEQDPLVLSAVLDALRKILEGQPRSAAHAELLPRLTPVLRNHNDDISQSCILLIGAIAQRSPSSAGPREWMRICAELVEIFKAPRKTVRRLANDTFGHIAAAIGPSDVLKSLLVSLKLERQSRVNAAVAIAIIADRVGPYAVLPPLLNEYRTPDITVQHGTLKALAFLFEYVDASAYLPSIVGLVDHALLSKNQVSRQTGASLVKYLGVSARGNGSEAIMVHFLNLLWPHIFEQSPHVIDRVLDAVQAVALALGPGAVLPYLWAGLFHSARSTREIYWRIYNLLYVQSSHAMVAHYPVEVQPYDVWF